MALLDYLMEGTSGAAATAAAVTSTPPGSQAQQVSPGTGGSIAFSSARVQAGSTSLLIDSPSGVSSVVRLPFAGTTDRLFAVEVYHYTPSTLISISPVAIRHASGVAARMHIGSNGNVSIQDSTLTLISSSEAGVVTPSAWFRYEITGQVGTTTSNGRIRIRVFALNGTTPLATVEATALNLNVNPVTHVDVGTVTVPSAAMIHNIDTVRLNNGTDTPIGPYIPATKLPTPVLTLVGTTQASSPVATDVTATVSWPAVPNAASYLAEIAPGLNATTGFVQVSATATSPFTFTGLAAGQYTFGITAYPAN